MLGLGLGQNPRHYSTSRDSPVLGTLVWLEKDSRNTAKSHSDSDWKKREGTISEHSEKVLFGWRVRTS